MDSRGNHEKRTTSFRLRRSQVERMARSGQASSVISYAAKRLRRGDFEIDRSVDSTRGEELVVVPFYGEPIGLTSHEIRLALDAHFSTRDEWLEREIEKARKDAELEWARLKAKGGMIVVEQE